MKNRKYDVYLSGFIKIEVDDMFTVAAPNRAIAERRARIELEKQTVGSCLTTDVDVNLEDCQPVRRHRR